MVLLLIEAESRETPEYVFLETLIQKVGLFDEYEILPVRGWTNLCQPAILMRMRLNSQEGGKNIIVFDADRDYFARKKQITVVLSEKSVTADIFLWPNNQSTGNLETLLLDMAELN